jgi:hypothetical protein
MDEQNGPATLLDTEYGTVVSHTSRYINIRLDSGLDVRAFHGAPEGSRLMVSLKRQADPDKGWLPLAVVESVFVERSAA